MSSKQQDAYIFGDEFDGVIMPSSPAKERVSLDRDFMFLFQEGVKHIAHDRKLTGESLRVFLFILTNLEFNNLIIKKQPDIAREMGLHSSAVGRAFRILAKRGMIHDTRETDGTRVWNLDINIGWRGAMHDYKERRKFRDENGILGYPYNAEADTTDA